MRTRIDFIARRMKATLARAGTEVTLVWQEWPAGTAPDPVDGTRAGTPTPRTEVVKAFVHFVNPTTQLRQFAEVAMGDCILDLHPDVELKGRAGLRFLIAGEEWSSKPVSSQLAQVWNALAAGEKLWQTVLLRRGT